LLSSVKHEGFVKLSKLEGKMKPETAKARILIPFFSLLFSIPINSGLVYGETNSNRYMNVTMKDIHYRGNDDYDVRILLINKIDKSVSIDELECKFYIQTEIIGQWRELKGRRLKPQGLILPASQKEIQILITIPVEKFKDVYRNFEGDINLLFTYRAVFHTEGSSEGLVDSGEFFYWLRPKTNIWILREGM